MKQMIFWCLLLILMISALELCLHIVTTLVPDNFLRATISTTLSPIIADKVLEHRPNPRYPEHDRNGFRNASVPDSTDIIVMGDSQTYGSGVARRSAWPQQLQRMTGYTVYNMAYGGYGPAHSLLLLDEALALKPKIVMEAMYAGNDLYDAFNLSYYANDLGTLKTQRPDAIKAIQEYEQELALRDKVLEPFYAVFPPAKVISGKAQGASEQVRTFALRHVRLYTLLGILKARVFSREQAVRNAWMKQKQQAIAQANDLLVLETSEIRTILTPRYRLAVLDFDDPRIEEGFNISVQSLASMKSRLDLARVLFAVLLIPTKELVYSSVVTVQNTINGPARQYYEQVIAHERRLGVRLKDELRRRRIVFLDMLPCLQEGIAEHLQLYPASPDGHPTLAGYEKISQCVQQGALLTSIGQATE